VAAAEMRYYAAGRHASHLNGASMEQLDGMLPPRDDPALRLARPAADEVLESSGDQLAHSGRVRLPDHSPNARWKLRTPLPAASRWEGAARPGPTSLRGGGDRLGQTPRAS
jgi:hypothetical protein